MQQDNSKLKEEKCQVSTFQVMMSVFASMIGVQKSEALKRDFECGKPGQFVVVGLVMTMAFILAVYGLVQIAFWYFAI